MNILNNNLRTEGHNRNAVVPYDGGVYIIRGHTLSGPPGGAPCDRERKRLQMDEGAQSEI